MKKIKSLSIGAVLWDIINGAEYIGGAPFNVAVNLKKLGEDSYILTSLGNDDRGNRAFDIIKGYDMSTLFVQRTNEFQTGYALATVDCNGCATYDLPEAAYDNILVDDKLIAQINDLNLDVLYFGTFEQRFEGNRKAVTRILNECNYKDAFFDVNLRMNFVNKEVIEFGFKKSTIVKVNDEEQLIISKLIYNIELSNEEFARRLVNDYSVNCVIVTLGKNGAYVYKDKDVYAECVDFPAAKRDTIGAGDAFSSAFISSYIRGDKIESTVKKGNTLGGYVASQTGALPTIPKEIVNIIKS